MGRRTGKQLPLGQREVKTYTLSGQLAAHWAFGADAGDPDDTSEATEYTHDPVTDRLALTHYPDGLEIEPTYDPAGTLTALLRDEPDAAETTLSYTLDSRGRPWRVQQADGSVVESLYDETGFRTRVRVDDECPMACGTVIHELTFTPDERGRLATVTERDDNPMTPDPKAEYAYDSRGRISHVYYYSDDAAAASPELTQIFTWDEDDPRDRLERLKWVRTAGAVIVADIAYTLDDAGHRTGIVHSGLIDDRAISYESDDTYRLTRETHHEYDPVLEVIGDQLLEIEYQYDAVGNRTRRRTWEGAARTLVEDTISTHDDNDRLLAAGTTSFTWDDRGRLTGENDGTGPITHAWSDDDRLLSVTGGAVDVAYTYDAEQRLIARAVGSGEPLRFVVDSGFQYAQALVEYTGDLAGTHDIEARHVFGHRLLAEERGGVLNWAVTDALGSVRGLVATGSGAFTGPWGYEAYGVETEAPEGVDLTHRFAGERRDAETGLDYLRARWMRPEWGGFLGRDPWEGELPLGLSRIPYPYALARPVSLTDPTGLRTGGELGATTSLIGMATRSVAQVIGPAVLAGGTAIGLGSFAVQQGFFEANLRVELERIQRDWNDCKDGCVGYARAVATALRRRGLKEGPQWQIILYANRPEMTGHIADLIVPGEIFAQLIGNERPISTNGRHYGVSINLRGRRLVSDHKLVLQPIDLWTTQYELAIRGTKVTALPWVGFRLAHVLRLGQLSHPPSDSIR